MASNTAESPDGDGGESKSNSKLDNLSRDDLVKFVKKQMVLLQKSKSQCDTLNRELTKTKDELKKLADSKPVGNDSGDLEEKETLIEAYNASQSALEESSVKIASLTEQMNCLQQKNETLTALYQCMQNEHDASVSRNKELESSIAVLSEARDEAIRQLTTLKHSENAADATKFVCSNCGDMKNKLEESMSALAEFKRQIESLEPIEGERERLKQEFGQTQEKLAKALVVIDKLKKERSQLKEQNADNMASQAALTDLQQLFDRVKQEKDDTDQEKQKALQDLDMAKSEADKTRQQLDAVILEKSELVSQMETLQKAVAELETQIKDATHEKEIYLQKVNALKDKLTNSEQLASALEKRATDAEASSRHFARAFDDIGRKFGQELRDRLEAGDALESFFGCLGVVGKELKGEDFTVNHFIDAERLVKDIKDEVLMIRKQLDIEKEANKGLNQQLVDLKDGKQTSADEIRPSGESDGSVNASDEVQELRLQIEGLKAEIEAQAKNKEELISANVALKLTIEQLESRQVSEGVVSRETSVSSDDNFLTPDKKNNKSLRVNREFSSESDQNITEMDVLLQEVMFSREKLAEWGTMMSMLQTEKDDLEKELTKVGEREARSNNLLEEILNSLQDALKGRDLFHDESKMADDNGLLYAKLCILQSIIDETNFERDEMREKIQHLDEQVVEMEKHVSESAHSGEAHLNTALHEVNKSFTEDRSLASAEKKEEEEVVLEKSSALERNIEVQSDDQSVIISELNGRIEILKTEIEELKRHLEVEKLESEKWKGFGEEKERIANDLLVEIEEKKLLEATGGFCKAHLNRELRASVVENVRTQEAKSALSDELVESCDSVEKTVEEGLDPGEKLMTEQIQWRTVKQNERFVIEMLSDEEKMRLLEENENLKEEIASLKRRLSEGKTNDVKELTLLEETSVNEENKTVETNLSEISKIELESQETCERESLEKSGKLEETGKRDGQDGKDVTLAVELERLQEECRQLSEKLDVQDLELKQKNCEIENLKSKQSWGWDDAETSDTENQMERMQEEFAKSKEEMETQITNKNEEILRLTAALSKINEESESKIHDDAASELRSEFLRIQLEMEGHLKDKDTMIENLKSDLSKIEEDKVNIQTEMNTLKSELANLKEKEADCVATHCAEIEELKRELVELREDFNAIVKESDHAVPSIKAEFAKAVEDSNLSIKEKNKVIENLEQELSQLKELQSNLKFKEDKMINLENDLSKIKEDYEAVISVKEIHIKELSEKLAASQEGGDLLKIKEVEFETKREELLKLKDAAEGLITEKDSEIERLKEELSKVTEISEKNVHDRDLEIENLRSEALETKSMLTNQVEKAEQGCKRLEEIVERINAEHDISIQEKDGEIARLTTELLHFKNETADLMTSKNNEIQFLKEEIARLQVVEHQVDNKSDEVDRLKAILDSTNEQNESLLKEREREISELSSELENSKKELTDIILSKNKELEKIHFDLDCERADREQLLQVKESKIKELEVCLEKLQADFNEISESNLKLMSLEKECEGLKVTVNDKENEMESMKEEILALRNQLDASFERKEDELSDVQSGQLEKNQVQASSSVSSSEALAELQQQLKQREQRENKLKQLTLKAKKETEELKTKLVSCQKDLEVTRAKLTEANGTNARNQSVQFQSLQTEYENLESLFESEKSCRQELEKNLKKAVEELTNTKVSSAELAETNSKITWELQKLEREKKELETLRAEKEQEVVAERIQREQLARDRAEMESRLLKAESQLKDLEAESKAEIKVLQDQIKASKQELSLAKTEIQQSNMIDLEIADYERAVKSLNETVSDRNAKIKSLQEEIDRQQEQKTAMQKLLDSSSAQYTQLDDHCNKLKQLLVKSKKDLAEAKKLESEQRTSEAQLRGQIERLTQLNEEQKLQISSLVAENQKQSDKLRLHSDTHQRTAQSLEQRVQTLEQDLVLARSELASVQADYDGYKVRVHSVLKHQKTKSGTGDDFSLEQERTERQQLEKLVDSLKAKLSDVSHQMSSIASDYEQLQEEHERLQLRHSKLITEMETNERNWRDRLEKANAENSMNSKRKVEAMQQLTSQTEAISASYKEQIQSIQEEHHRVVQSLRQQLETTEIELDRYHARLQSMSQNSMGNSAVPLHSLDHETSPDRVLDFVKELRPEERQSGEGSENIEDVLVKTSAANHSLLPFEQLLDSSQMDDVISVKTMESTAEEMALKASLTSAEKRIEHLTQILNESEATVLRLTEQASILKGEIRRMERNQERETAISNMEYLKNIVYKFLTLKSGDERLQLIPVLTTMLKLSPDEKDKMTSIATGGAEGVPSSGQDAAGWGAYLHRWSGLV